MKSIVTVFVSLAAATSGCALAPCGSRPAAVVEHLELAAAPVPPSVQALTPVAPVPGSATVVIEVDAAHPGQVMDGIGGTFNELGWDALLALPETARRELLRELFDPKTGAGLCFNRIPIGASDFGKNAYSLDDTKDDYELKHFSIKRDEGCLIPYIKAAQAFNPRMKFHASPWSPPGWMKTNGSQTGGGELKSDERTLRAHSAYLVKFLTAYAMHGIMVNRLCPQNEPLVAGNYPGCKIPAPLYSKMMREYLVPAVKLCSATKTEVWAGTFNYWQDSTKAHYEGIRDDAALAAAIGGISFQYAHLPWVREYHAKYPHVPMQFSESQCYGGDNSKNEALRDFQDFVAYTRAGCQLYTFWNMVLAEPRKSTWGWRQNSLIVIDKAKQTVAYQPSFALAKFLGRHVTPGARYLPATVASGDVGIGALKYPPTQGIGFMQSELDKGAQIAAFQKPDGTTVVYLMNHGPQAKAQIKVGTQTTELTLPANSLCAVIMPGVR